MSDQVFLNNADGTSQALVNPGDGTITVDATLAGQIAAVNFPAEFILMTINAPASPSVWEIVKVTAIAGQVLTVTRAQEGTAAGTWASGSQVSGRATRDSYDRARRQVFRILTDATGLILLGASGDILIGAEV